MSLQAHLDISQSRDVASFERCLVGFTDDFGFSLVTSMVVVDPTPFREATSLTVSNIPASFAAASTNDVDTARDPVMRRLRRSSIPFAYDQNTYVEAGAGDLWEEQAAHGYRTGIAVALHLHDNTHFLLGVDRHSPLPQDRDEMTHLMAALQLFAVHAQDAAIKFVIPDDAVVNVPNLTMRELDVLRWTKVGKSSWTVGTILGISETTVNFHVRNAIRKLNTSSKHQAVLKALSYGLI